MGSKYICFSNNLNKLKTKSVPKVPKGGHKSGHNAAARPSPLGWLVEIIPGKKEK